MVQRISISQKDVGLRLDKFLQELYGLPFGKVQQLCRKGFIRLDGKRVKGDARLQLGQELKLPQSVEVQEPVVHDIQKDYAPSSAALKSAKDMIIGEDDQLIWVNKPVDLPVQAGTGHVKSLDRLLQGLYPEAAPKLLHRIDKATSGLILFGKDAETARMMTQAFKTQDIQKTYIALLSGKLPAQEGSIKAPLLKAGQKGHEKVVIHHDGKNSITEFKCLQSFGKNLHLVEFQPKTGRMHQLRVHAAEMLKCPIVGDWKYGGEKAKIKGEGIVNGRMYLHAYQATFKHPKTGEIITLTAELPKHFQKFMSFMQTS